MLLLIANAAAVTVSVTTNSGENSINVVHYYVAGKYAKYEVENSGKIDDTGVSESFDYTGSISTTLAGVIPIMSPNNGDDQNGVKVEHVVTGNNYKIESTHSITNSGSDSKISEKGSIDASFENGKIDKEVNDEGMSIESQVLVENRDGQYSFAFAKYELNEGSIKGTQSASTGSAHASQKLSVSNDNFDVEFYAQAGTDTNNDGSVDE